MGGVIFMTNVSDSVKKEVGLTFEDIGAEKGDKLRSDIIEQAKIYKFLIELHVKEKLKKDITLEAFVELFMEVGVSEKTKSNSKKFNNLINLYVLSSLILEKMEDIRNSSSIMYAINILSEICHKSETIHHNKVFKSVYASQSHARYEDKGKKNELKKLEEIWDNGQWKNEGRGKYNNFANHVIYNDLVEKISFNMITRHISKYDKK